MKRSRKAFCIVLALFLVFNLLTPFVSGVTVLSDLSDDFAKSYNYIIIGTVINKTVESNQTHYVLNVTENLKKPINTTQITITTMGGSEIAVSPSTTFYTGVEYLVFFNELDEDSEIVGFDYVSSLLSSLDSDTLQTIREVADVRNLSNIAQPDLVKDHGILMDKIYDYGASYQGFLLIGFIVLMLIGLYKIFRH